MENIGIVLAAFLFAKYRKKEQSPIKKQYAMGWTA